MSDKQYNELMKVYSDRYYVQKNTDGIYVLVNHAAWKVLRGHSHDKAQVHIESYDKEAKRLLLTMTKGSICEGRGAGGGEWLALLEWFDV